MSWSRLAGSQACVERIIENILVVRKAHSGNSNELPVPRPLVFFWSGRNPHAAQFFGIIFAEQHVPLFAALEDLLFLRSNPLANLLLDSFLFLQDIRHRLHHVLPDGVAVLHEFHFVALHQQVDDLVRDANHFFARQSHFSLSPRFPALPQNQFPVAGYLPLHLLKHLLVRNPRPPHFVLMLRQDVSHFFVHFVFHRDLFHHPQSYTRNDRVQILFFDLDETVINKFLDHFRRHVAHIISIQKHLSDFPLRVCKQLSLQGPTKIGKKGTVSLEKHSLAPTARLRPKTCPPQKVRTPLPPEKLKDCPSKIS